MDVELPVIVHGLPCYRGPLPMDFSDKGNRVPTGHLVEVSKFFSLDMWVHMQKASRIPMGNTLRFVV